MLWYTTRGAGAVSLVLLTAVVALGILSSLRFEAKGWPRFLTAGLHRNLALVTLVFLGLHIVTAVVDPYTNLGWASAIVPFSSYYRTFWLGLGTIAAELVAAIGITSLARRFIGPRAWKVVHGLAYAAWPIGVVHGLGTGVLREGTRQVLKSLPYVKNYQDGGVGHGGAGATVVEFDRD